MRGPRSLPDTHTPGTTPRQNREAETEGVWVEVVVSWETAVQAVVLVAQVVGRCRLRYNTWHDCTCWEIDRYDHRTSIHRPHVA